VGSETTSKASGLFSEGFTSLFPRRFVVNALVPVGLFSVGIASAVVGFAVGFAGVGTWWFGLDIIGRLLLTVAAGLLLFFLATALASLWRAIVRLFEGYPFLGLARRRGWKALLGIAYQEAVLNRMKNPYQRYERYAHPQHEKDMSENLMPTKLGNILRSAEIYPLRCYGMDAIVFWPRLYCVLPDDFRLDFEQFVSEYELPLVISFLAGLSGVIISVLALYTGQSLETVLAIVFVSSIVSWLSYAAALSPAAQMAEQMKVAFDMYRHLLLEQWPTVADIEDECEAFGLIRKFILQKAPLSWAKSQARHARRR
jgi:hypothetical protein